MRTFPYKNGYKAPKLQTHRTSPRQSVPTIAIVGGAASGIAAVLHLIRNATRPLAIKIVEPRDQLGSGVAYSTESPLHLLNVPAGNMSVFNDVPGHFLEWLHANGLPDAEPASFVSRSRYGAYLNSVLLDEFRRTRPTITLEHVRSRATRLSRNRDAFTIETNSAGSFR